MTTFGFVCFLIGICVNTRVVCFARAHQPPHSLRPCCAPGVRPGCDSGL